MDKKLCVCIPTYNRCDAIKTVLDTELDIFKRYGIDLILCDSSDNREIESLAERQRQGGADCLFYRRFDSDIFPNEKVFQIFEYRYWVY